MASEPIGAERFKRLSAQLFNMLRKPKPHYELFTDRETMAPWFAMILFPTEREWEAYRLCRTLKKFLLDLGATATRLGDPRFTRMTDGMVAMIDTALTTEPREGEEYDGRLRGA
ncbi:MAG: hypothetical protein M0R22_00070 [Dehalococcoidia bacterium]|jgi:hypothetical protein|nr:hypothetical protein [Dehalococcoidia bacterium]